MGCLSTKSQSPEKSKSTKDQTRVDQKDKALAQLMVTRDQLTRYNKKIQTNINQCKEAVKLCIKNKEKPKALLALRKQKYLEKQLESGQGSLLNIQQMINDVQNALIQETVYQALKEGNKFLEKINSQMKLDDVEKLMEDTAEAIAYQEEIGQMLAQNGVPEDDTDILKQFEELDSLEALDYELPSAPQNKLVQEEKKREVREERKEVINYN